MPVLKIAGCQVQFSADIEQNLAEIERSISEAASSGADIIVFPEGSVTGYAPVHYAQVSDIDLAIVEQANRAVCGWAREYAIHVVAGTIVESESGLLNSAMLINDTGDIIGTQNKLHMFGNDAKYFVPGNSVECFDVKGVKVGLAVCYDIRFPEVFRAAKALGCELVATILYGCDHKLWKMPVLEGMFRARAAENTFYIAAVNAAGPGQMCVSRICDPRGVDLAVARHDERQIILAEIDTDNCRSGCYDDIRPELYRNLKMYP